MGKILSGGYAYESQFLPNKQENIVPIESKEIAAPQEQVPESWGEYGLRNIAKIPALAWETGRSGFGLGNLAKAVSQSPILSLPPEWRMLEQLGARRVLMPSAEEAGAEAAAVLPKYMTEHRPEDYWAEMGITGLPLLAAGGGFSSIPKLAAGIGSLGLTYGASKLGETAGGEIGEAIGDRPLGEEIGKLAGLVGGEKAVSKAETYAANRPTRYFPEKIKSHFEKINQDAVAGIGKEITGYKENIKRLDQERTKNYAEAQKLEGNIKGPTNQILDHINRVAENISEGVSPADTKAITDNLKQLEQASISGNLSLKSAKRFQKNFNDQIYNFGNSLTFNKNMGDVVSGLNNFIDEVGGPEHSKYWKPAEAATVELKNLKRNAKQFMQSKKQAMHEAQAQGKKNAKIAADVAKMAESGTVGKYGPAGISGLLGYLAGGTKLGAITGLAGKAGQLLYKEISFGREMMKKYPEIYNDYKNLVDNYDTIPRNIKKIIINKIGERMESAKK